MYWYLKVLKQYAVFSGRARRKEFWMFCLFNVIFFIVAMLLDNILGLAIEELGYGPISVLYILGVYIPSLAVTARRLHDIEYSGWWQLFNIIPFGAIWILVLLCRDGDDGENYYGSDPKEE
jgi:uncharacterized membrane protein YhaH (DUF805 family)